MLFWESLEKQCREFAFEDSPASLQTFAAGHTLAVIGGGSVWR